MLSFLLLSCVNYGYACWRWVYSVRMWDRTRILFIHTTVNISWKIRVLHFLHSPYLYPSGQPHHHPLRWEEAPAEQTWCLENVTASKKEEYLYGNNLWKCYFWPDHAIVPVRQRSDEADWKKLIMWPYSNNLLGNVLCHAPYTCQESFFVHKNLVIKYRLLYNLNLLQNCDLTPKTCEEVLRHYFFQQIHTHIHLNSFG